MVALKYANQLRSALPDSNIFDIYADMRAFGKKCEEFYMNTAKRNILFLNFDQQQGLPRIDMPQISKAQPDDGCEMIIEMNERLSGEKIEVPADLVILMVGMEAHESAK